MTGRSSMSTGRTSAPDSRYRRLAALLSLALLGPAFAACGDDDVPVSPDDPERYVVEAIERTLHQRARAMLNGDSVGFDRSLARRDAAFVEAQDRYYGNVTQLPLGAVRFTLGTESLEPDGPDGGDGGAYWAEITIRLQIEGYDVAPVVTRDRWRFVPTANQRRYLLASTTDRAWEADHPSQPQPWDLDEEIEVRDAPGVLGIFDDDSLGSASSVLDAVSLGRFQVKSVLPTELSDPGGVVLYALSDPAFVDSLSGLPFSDPDRLDGATIPVPRDATDADGRVASYRILLSPHVLDQGEEVLDRLVRHELTHVALGERAQGVPLWLTEGIAEYVSVQPIAPAERRLQTDALNLAASGVDDLPSDADFGGEHAEGWYAVSWWVCEYIAATYGADALWLLLDALHDGGDQASVISQQLGISTSALAEQGVALMRRTYG
ncbi:hypothetical protein F0U44_18655 [Nocardioides humilatus]|uniref:Peptidase MA-like domain-containing protein n=1 Tax=Nocardioides humilatus TaxID=2607660 RepID=A0A5B1L7E0_9ACTN|nr:hypothetical protein [Nocardioides humilatus]KAA1416346.1 hypothetical protein F0U44_18655 [Nocardioides humilatus]